MSDKPPKKPLGIPPFYWSRPPPGPKTKGYVNKEQKRFRLVMAAFTLAKVVAFTLVALVIIGMI